MKTGYFIFLVAVLFFTLLGNSYSDEFRRSIVIELPDISPTINIHQSNETALAAASGQHHYKATTDLQWSGAGAFTSINDESAVSFGLGQQVDNVFVAGNYSFNGDYYIVGVSASGTF